MLLSLQNCNTMICAPSFILAISQLTVATVVVDALPVASTIGFVFYSFTLQLVKCCYCHYCFHWLLPPLVVGPTIGSAFARTTFLPRQLRCDLTDLVSTWHFLPLLLLFMNFWDQLMMKELRSIFGLNFAFYFSRSFISSENPACNWWWGIKPRESRSRFGPKVTFLPPFFQSSVFSWWGRNQCFFSWSSSPTVCIC